MNVPHVDDTDRASASAGESPSGYITLNVVLNVMDHISRNTAEYPRLAQNTGKRKVGESHSGKQCHYREYRDAAAAAQGTAEFGPSLKKP